MDSNTQKKSPMFAEVNVERQAKEFQWDRGQALVPALKINKLQASSLASVYGRGMAA